MARWMPSRAVNELTQSTDSRRRAGVFALFGSMGEAVLGRMHAKLGGPGLQPRDRVSVRLFKIVFPVQVPPGGK